MKIPLTQGQATLIDDADWPLVAPRNWWATRTPSGDYYATTKIRQPDGRRRVVHMQRLLMGDPTGRKVDHVSRDTLDNRRENLRVATDSQNKTNSRLYRNNSTGLRGVRNWNDGRALPWYAQISRDGRKRYLGSFLTAEEASAAYDAAARALHGEYATTNDG